MTHFKKIELETDGRSGGDVDAAEEGSSSEYSDDNNISHLRKSNRIPKPSAAGAATKGIPQETLLEKAKGEIKERGVHHVGCIYASIPLNQV